MGPDPALATARRAVRHATVDLAPAALVLVACSGGADSLALAAAAAFVVPRQGRRAGAVIVDHGLQPGSAERARDLAATLAGLDLAPVDIRTVTVGADGGPEAAARAARYTALDAAADEHGAEAVLLGHTLDDQAETVLLGLARGSGARSLAGMAATAGPGGRYRRPLLGLTRSQVRQACSAAGLRAWQDPHNADPRYARVRVREHLLPELERALGPGVAAALARTAALLARDADALDGWAERVAAQTTDPDGTLDCAALAGLPAAVRTRVLRRAAVAAGATAGGLFAAHVEGIDALVTGWRGQQGVDLPGGVRVSRRCGRLTFRASHRSG